ncbi:ubiquitin-conjugating enzyme e2, putative [Eimeria mitis]|uniref:Ubiquitin-conjugating enzyme e2, putative n=1 Tax=Eimeria mitis TaxID=44415 RepID=U6JWM9_9EIME|nr:ubiquitin-conjugating enzyme e2, putative [Eimeria mitis]CDJ29855.1 ubiquitin-conjugating enzyme e2, putative [Eimeria mitis]
MEAAHDSSRGGAAQHASTAQSLARILREHRDIQRNASPHWTAAPLSVSILLFADEALEEPREWHFTLRGPPDSPFEGGLYHGRIVLPKNYPFAPPSLMLLTRNGRFDINKKICLSASSHHPELWQPAWGIRTLLDALCAFFPTPAQGALHALEASEKDRRQMALESASWVCPVCKRPNRQLVEEGCAAPSNTLPELPEQLQAQALLARDRGKEQPSKTEAVQGPLPNSQVGSPSDVGTAAAVPPSRSNSGNNSGNSAANISSGSDGLSVTRDAGVLPTGRRPARPQASSFWAYRLASQVFSAAPLAFAQQLILRDLPSLAISNSYKSAKSIL